MLARNGRAPIGELRYYADTRLDRFSTPLAQGAARRGAGDDRRQAAGRDGHSPRRSAASTLSGDERLGVYRADYGSGLRDSAALVTLAAETNIANDRGAEARQRHRQGVLGPQPTRRRRSRRGCCWPRTRWPSRRNEPKLDRQRRAGRGIAAASLPAAELREGAAHRRQRGRAPIDAVVTVIGAGADARASGLQGLHGRAQLLHARRHAGRSCERDRRLRTAQAERAPGRGREARGQDAGGRVLLVDRLPAGFEIENPRLVESGDVKALRLAEDDRAAGARRVPRRPLRRRLQLLRRRRAGADTGNATPTARRRPRARPPRRRSPTWCAR